MTQLRRPTRLPIGPARITPTRVPGVRAALARWADTVRQLLPRLA